MSDELLLEIVKVVATLAGTAISVLLPMLLGLAVKKWKLDVTEKQEAQLTHAAREAVSIIEELAAAKLKARGEAMSARDKFAGAVATVIEKLPQSDLAEVERKVTAALPDLGMGAAVTVPNAPGTSGL